MDSSTLINSAATVLSAVIGSTIAVNMTLKNDRLKTEDTRKHDRISVCLALHAEITVVFNRYSMETGKHLRETPDGEIFPYHYPLEENYFTIFDSNSSAIGKIDDDHLRISIVETYLYMKGLVDSFRHYNSILSQYEETKNKLMENSEYRNPERHNSLNKILKIKESEMKEYSAILKETDSSTFLAVSRTLRLLEKYTMFHQYPGTDFT